MGVALEQSPRQVGFDRFFCGYWDLIRHIGEGIYWSPIFSQFRPYFDNFPLLCSTGNIDIPNQFIKMLNFPLSFIIHRKQDK